MFLSVVPAQSALAQFDPSEIERVYQSKDYAKVETIAQARLLIDPYDVRARYYLASVLLQQKRGAQALVQFEACAKCGGSSPLAQMARKAIETLKIDGKKENPQYYVRPKALTKKRSGLSSTLDSKSGSTLDSKSGLVLDSKSGSALDSKTGSVLDSDSDLDPATKESVAHMRKDLADAIEVKRRRQALALEAVADEESLAIQEIMGTLSVTRDEQLEAARAEGATKRAKVYRLYKDEEDAITKAYQMRIDSLKNSRKKPE
ncbi:hypothetical protein BH11CYA1_BH11CYA1_21380 [soil metagenome]